MKDYTHLTILLDRSGSMGPIQAATIEGYNAFINEQKAAPGAGSVTLIQFDDQYEVNYRDLPEKDVPILTGQTYQPRGMTALIYAVCRTIDETGQRLAALPESERPNKVVMAIITDGQENTPMGFTLADMNARIAHQREKYNWKFAFLGANQDAIASAGQMGISRMSASNFDATNDGVKKAFGKLSVANRAYKADGNDTCAEYILPPDEEVDLQKSSPSAVGNS